MGIDQRGRRGHWLTITSGSTQFVSMFRIIFHGPEKGGQQEKTANDGPNIGAFVADKRHSNGFKTVFSQAEVGGGANDFRIAILVGSYARLLPIDVEFGTGGLAVDER